MIQAVQYKKFHEDHKLRAKLLSNTDTITASKNEAILSNNYTFRSGNVSNAATLEIPTEKAYEVYQESIKVSILDLSSHLPPCECISLSHVDDTLVHPIINEDNVIEEFDGLSVSEDVS